ncbi:MAG: hypothetical protein DCF25_06400 [Leptolyngbya foveolarum]|uniref:Histidine kinase n=1 Tax=Leptolyngbya foveolarum TaxID=47253 RepID=A0A2W4UMU7_9CYAN|nr:MAG: hypothetical protein DCF25_06400 [Leptolyngbya foveolarum]
MFKVAVGHSVDPDSIEAIEEVLAQCQKTLGEDSPQAGIVFAATDFEHRDILERIQTAYPGILLVGGTSSAEMSSQAAFQQDSLAVMLFCSDEITFSVGVGHGACDDEAAAAQDAIASANAPNMKLCYALCEGIGVDGMALTQGLKAAIGRAVPVFGGFTADDCRFEHTYQFLGSEVMEGTVVVLTFSGNLNVSYGVATGQIPIGRKATVTKSERYTLHEIDGQPAKQFYIDYFGEQKIKVAGNSRVSAIAVHEPDSDNFYLRSPHSENAEAGSVKYFSHVPEQSIIQLASPSEDSLLQAAREAFEKAQVAYQGHEPSAALIVSCVSRQRNLGTRITEEYKVAESFLGAELPKLGFYSFGEISPFTEETTPQFHNETFAALLIGTN